MEEIGFPNPYKLKPNMKEEKPMHLINQKHNIFPQFWMHEQYAWGRKIRKSIMHGGEMKKKMNMNTHPNQVLGVP